MHRSKMNPRESHPRPIPTLRSSHHARRHVHRMLEAELRDIRQCLAQLERQLDGNVIEMRPRECEEDRAA